MPRSHRLFTLLQTLRDGQLHTAQSLADALSVSVRTVYRDMDTLAASGVPVVGTRGTGYALTHTITLPPLTLTSAEMDALNLGLAIAGQVADPDLRAAALSLTDKIDAVLPETAIAEADEWKFAATPFSNTARGLGHMPVLRAAIKARQKLRITYTNNDGAVTSRTIRPLKLEYWNRIWMLTAWCEWRQARRVFRLDLINTADALAELFTNQEGMTLADVRP